MKSLSMKSLGLPTDIVTVFRITEAPAVLQEIDISGKASQVIVIPTKLKGSIVVAARACYEEIRGGTVYVI